MIDIHDDRTLFYKRAVWNGAAARAAQPPVDVPDADLYVGIYFENMGTVGDPYRGSLGRIRSVAIEPVFSLEDVSPKFTDPVSPDMFKPTGYLGEPWGV